MMLNAATSFAWSGSGFGRFGRFVGILAFWLRLIASHLAKFAWSFDEPPLGRSPLQCRRWIGRLGKSFTLPGRAVLLGGFDCTLQRLLAQPQGTVQTA
jgi:hypothetical protein